MTTEVAQQQDTKRQIIDVAQRLFAENGFESVSLRHITAEAGVNVAAVNYHFGSKEKLIDAVIERRIVPINDRRLQMLGDLEERFGDDPVPTKEIVRALLLPLLEEVRSSVLGEKLFYKLMGRCLSHRGFEIPSSVIGQFHEVVKRFTEAILKGKPDLSPREIVWRLHFTAGVLIQTLIHSDKVDQITEGKFPPTSAEESFENMVAYCAAGFSADPVMEMNAKREGGEV